MVAPRRCWHQLAMGVVGFLRRQRQLPSIDDVAKLRVGSYVNWDKYAHNAVDSIAFWNLIIGGASSPSSPLYYPPPLPLPPLIVPKRRAVLTVGRKAAMRQVCRGVQRCVVLELGVSHITVVRCLA